MKQLTKKVVRDIIIARRECGDFCDDGAEAGLEFLKSCGDVITVGDIVRADMARIAVYKLLAALPEGYALTGGRVQVEQACRNVSEIDNITLVIEEEVLGGEFKLSDGDVQMTLARGARLHVTSFGGSLKVNGVAVTERGVHDSFTVVNDGKGVRREDIENRTGYTVVMQDGTVYKSLPAVRVDLARHEVAPCVISVKADGVFNLPPVREGVMLIVTHTVAKYLWREDFLVPGRRDADGRTGWLEIPGVPEVRGVGPARGREGSER